MGADLSLVQRQPLTNSTSLLYYISPDVISEQLFIKNVHEDKLELPNLRVTLLDVDCPHHRKYYGMVKDYVRENSDGVMFVVDATMHGDDNQRNEDHILSEYMLNLEGTQGGVLVVLVDRAEEEGARSVVEIEQGIQSLLLKYGRNKQRYAVFSVNTKERTGLVPALDWFAARLNEGLGEE